MPVASDLGFSFSVRKNGDVAIMHNGRLATTLRDTAAMKFIAAVEHDNEADAQQRMARVTGNDKRGNERTARNHPRNRG